MAEFFHLVGIEAPPERVFAALTEEAGLAGWWTRDTTVNGDGTGNSAVGDTIVFRFGNHSDEMEIVELEPNRRVAWKVLGGTEDWVGSVISFELTEEAGGTMVFFRHGPIGEVTRFAAFCSTKWALFLLSLKALIETGTGRPYPDDVRITHT